MPCIKCANGKWKYGEHGNCQFDTLAACKAAAAAIHIDTPAGPHQAPKAAMTPVSAEIIDNPCVDSTHEDMTQEMLNHYK